MLIKLLFVGLSCGLASVSLLIPYSLPPKCGVHFPTILLGLDEKDRDVKQVKEQVHNYFTDTA